MRRWTLLIHEYGAYVASYTGPPPEPLPPGWEAVEVVEAEIGDMERPATIHEMGTEWVELADWEDMRKRWQILGRVSKRTIDRLKAELDRERTARRVVDQALREALQRARVG